MILNIISLPHRKDRLQGAIKQCEEAGIEYRVWPGIKADTPKQGISQAHKQIVRWAKENNHPSVLIAEDDFLFTHQSSFKRYMDCMPETFDIYLGGISGGQLDKSNGVVITQFSGLFFYMVNHTFYDCFLEADEEMHIDMYVGLPQAKILETLNGRKPRIVCCYPITVITTDGFSDNTSQPMRNSIFFLPYAQWGVMKDKSRKILYPKQS